MENDKIGYNIKCIDKDDHREGDGGYAYFTGFKES